MARLEFELSFADLADKGVGHVYRLRASSPLGTVDTEFRVPDTKKLDDRLDTVQTLISISGFPLVQRGKATTL